MPGRVFRELLTIMYLLIVSIISYTYFPSKSILAARLLSMCATVILLLTAPLLSLLAGTVNLSACYAIYGF